MEPVRIINRHGYSILKHAYEEKDLKRVKKELTIIPHTDKPEYGAPTPYKNYKETDDRLYMPTKYALKKFGIPEDNLIYEGDDIDTNFSFTLRKNQEKITNKCLKHIKKHGGGVLSMYCGGGKTIMALWLIAQIKKKTLILVHTSDLMEQWIERINSAMPGTRIGIIQQNKVEVENNDIVIGMIQSISKKDYPLHIFESFGFIVADEVHLMATKIFSRSFFKTVSKYSLGLSATPYRNDKCERVFTQHMGDIIHYEKRDGNPDLKVNCIVYKIDKFYPEFDRLGNVSYVNTLKKVCNNEDRINLIVENAVKLVKENRKILILGEYIDHLKKIYLCFENNSYKDMSFGLMIGEKNSEDRASARSCDVIIATYKLASVGMDVKDLSALILASPRKYGPNLQQSVGRILRETDPDMKPMIIDIIDKFHYFYYQGFGSKKNKGRVDFYKEYNYDVEFTNMNNTGDESENDEINNENILSDEYGFI